MNRISHLSPIVGLFALVSLPFVAFAQPTATPASGFRWVKTGTGLYDTGETSTTPTVADHQNTSYGKVGDSDPADCSLSCGGKCDGDEFIKIKVFGTSDAPSSTCEQRAHILHHWNNAYPNSGVSNGASSGTVYLPTSATLQVIQGTPGTGGGGSTNHTNIIGGLGGSNTSKFTVTVNWSIAWSTTALGGISDGTGTQTHIGSFNATDPGGSNASGAPAWSTDFGTSFGATYSVPIASLPQTGGTFEMKYVGNSSISIVRDYGNADGEGIHSPGLEGRTKHTVNYDIWQLQAVLPIELSDLSVVSKEKSHATLNWVTASELNSQEFAVERSKDGVRWSKIGTVKAAGQSATEKKYQFEDVATYEGVNYYRLKSIDFDGTSSTSKFVSIEMARSAKKLEVYPNPAKTDLRVSFGTTDEDNVTVRVFDILGRLILNEKHIVTKGENQIGLDISQLVNGTYLLNIGEEVTKFQKN